jgi:hypothetical protein
MILDLSYNIFYKVLILWDIIVLAKLKKFGKVLNSILHNCEPYYIFFFLFI